MLGICFFSLGEKFSASGRIPLIALHLEGEKGVEVLREFGYEDFRDRLS